jgi:hypothetical protein
LPKVGLVHKMTSQYVDRYISESNMINKYSRYSDGMQALFSFCTNRELLRQVVYVLF